MIFSLRDIVVTAIIFICLPYIIKNPSIGVLIWSWLGYMNPHKLSWGFASNFPFAQIVALVTLVGLIFTKEPKKIPWTRETVLLLLFSLWTIFTTAAAMYHTEALREADRFWKIIFMTFIAMMVMGDKEKLQSWIWIIALSLGFYGIKGGIFTLITGGNNHVWGPEGTFIGGNNEIGLALIIAIPLLRYCQISTQNHWLKRLLLICMILCVLAIVGTQSRGAYLGIMATLFFMLKNSRHKFTLLLVVALLIPAVYLYMPASWHERMASISKFYEDGSALGRINAWWMAFYLASDRFFGGGFQCFQKASFAIYAPDPMDIHDAHSIYFEVLGEQGFLGLALFILLLLSAWRSCRWIMKKTKSKEELKWAYDMAAMVQVSLLGYMISGAFLGLAYFDLYYNLIALIVLIKVIVHRVLVGEVQIKEKVFIRTCQDP